MQTIRIIAIAASLAVLGTGASAMAQTTASAAVETTGVDFANAGSVGQLKDRIERVARRVCQVGKTRDLGIEQRSRECFRQSVASATSQIDQQVAMHGRGSPALTLNVGKVPAK